MSHSFAEVDSYQICKRKQSSPGDTFLSRKNMADGRVISVLSDGLGSGIKANVLATLTATIALGCVSENVPIAKTAEMITRTLPICSRRKISYSTFTIVDVSKSKFVKIIEYDNPATLVFRGNEILPLERREIAFKNVCSNESNIIKPRVTYTEFQAQSGDRIILCSDGLPQSGMGTKAFPRGWGAKNLLAAAEEYITTAPAISARALARYLVRRALHNDSEEAKDDMTCGVIYFREPRQLLLASGPPFHQESDAVMADFVRQFKGKKIVCGGTTANILAREFHTELKTNWRGADRSLPPTSQMKGVDLVTEGVITLSKVAELLENQRQFENIPPHGAMQIIEEFLNADLIHFLIGTKINESHLDPAFPVELEIRRTLMRRIAGLLEKKFLKEVRLQYI